MWHEDEKLYQFPKEIYSNFVTNFSIVREKIETNYSDYIPRFFYQITDFIEKSQVDYITPQLKSLYQTLHNNINCNVPGLKTEG